MGTQSENWLWTLDVQDNPSADLEGYVHTVYEAAGDSIKYIVAGEEIGPENGRRHFQGMVSLGHRMRGRTVKPFFQNDRVHIGDSDGRPCRDVAASIEYCKKDGKFIEIGEAPVQRGAGDPSKKKWVRARDLAQAGQVQAIFDENPDFIRYQDHLYKYAARFNKPVDRPTLDNFWLHGPSGSGKSRGIRLKEGDKLYVVGDIGRFMWQDFDVTKHEAVLFDDMRVEDIRPNCKLLKNILDHYPFRAELKGSSLGLIRPKRVYFTSLLPMKEVVPYDHLSEFERRVRVLTVEEFKQPS